MIACRQAGWLGGTVGCRFSTALGPAGAAAPDCGQSLTNGSVCTLLQCVLLADAEMHSAPPGQLSASAVRDQQLFQLD